MNCVSCGLFSPLAGPEFADYEKTARDFARLSALSHGQAKDIYLAGGEPLLHPDLLKILKMARENFPDAVISIVTNGLLLLNQPEEFWTVCKENNIWIEQTKYPIALNFEEIEKCAADHGVKHQYYNGAKVVKAMNSYKLDVEGRQDCQKSFLLCYQANSCVTLQNGRLYTCATVGAIRHFNKYFGENLQEHPGDSIDIYQANSMREIMDFLARPIPFCRYCMPDKTVYDQPWRKSERAIEGWT